MTEDQRIHILTTLTSLKDWVRRCPGFLNDDELKAIYVIVSTAEGAVMFGDVDELAGLCAGFARKKATEIDDDGPHEFRVVGS